MGSNRLMGMAQGKSCKPLGVKKQWGDLVGRGGGLFTVGQWVVEGWEGLSHNSAVLTARCFIVVYTCIN